MNFPILIVPNEMGDGFTASAGSPFGLTVAGTTSEEAYEKLFALMLERVRNGGQVRWASLPDNWLRQFPAPDALDKEITRDWLNAIEQYRRECDEIDRRRLDEEEAKARNAS